ncbi:MAG TPA: DNA replication and repair protein RecF [Thermoleophilia bacterium]|nr:DNA replication and repair protein RecF [Thermoleophilia bacterium]
MIVRTVRLSGVRCHESLVVELGPGISVLVGANGAGKTSVLEGIHVVLSGGSPRTTQPKELISWGQETLRAELDLLGDDGRVCTAAFGYSDSGERRCTADGAPLVDTSRWEESLPVRMFLPDDVRLVRGSPRRRRRFVDRMAVTADPSYRNDLSAYDEALSQRNTLLRRGIVGQDHSAWEALMARTGLKIVRARTRTLQSVSGPYASLHDLLAAPRVDSPPALVYRTNASDLDETGYRERLAEQRESDRRRTFTNLGPHRDDVRFTYQNRDLRSFGSQGEQRTALLALLLAERVWTAERTGSAPLLLLDDVMSELDEPRRRALIALLGEGGQVVITTTDLHHFGAEELLPMTVVPLGPPGGAAE